LGRTNWTWLLVAVLALLGYMRWRPRGEFAEMLKRYPAFSVAIAAALFAGVIGYFTEDSGIIIPALMFIPVGVTALYLMLLPFAHKESGEV
jgi:O-antigen ligase